MFKLMGLRKNEKGEAMVELALTLPLILLITMGIIQFGLIFNAYLILRGASREASRLGTVEETDQNICNRIWNVTSTLNRGNITVVITETNENGDPVNDPDDPLSGGPNSYSLQANVSPLEDPGWPSDPESGDPLSTEKLYGYYIKVEVQYKMDLGMPIIKQILSNHLNLSQVSTMRIE